MHNSMTSKGNRQDLSWKMNIMGAQKATYHEYI